LRYVVSSYTILQDYTLMDGQIKHNAFNITSLFYFVKLLFNLYSWHDYALSNFRIKQLLILSKILKGPYLYHGPIGLRLHLAQQKDLRSSIMVQNQSYIETSRHPTYCLIRYVNMIIVNDEI
jgi:hypothetical protein